MVNCEWHTHGQKFLYTSLEFEVKYFKSFFDAISSSFKVDPRFLGQYVENFEMHMGDVLCPRDDDEEEEDDDDTTSTQVDHIDDGDEILYITSIRVAELLQSMVKLKRLKLPIGIWECFSELSTILKSCGNIENVNCIASSIDVLAHLYGHQLRSLTVDERGLYFQHVLKIPSLFQNLEHLEISHCRLILSSEFLEDLAINCQKLRRLYLRGCKYSSLRGKERKITVSLLKTLAISIEDVDTIWLAHIATRYPDLQELQLTATSNPQSFSVSEWQTGFQAIADRCTKLEKLYCHSNSKKGAFHPTKTFFDKFSQTTNGGLKSLTIVAHTAEFRDKDLLSVAMCAGKTMTDLELDDCPFISIKGFNDALSLCSTLTELTLSTKEFTPSVLLKHCPNIKSFTLKDATILQETYNSGRYQLIQLTNICLYGVEKANVFINAISQYTPKLRHISITEQNTFDPSEYRLSLPNSTIHYLDIEWIVWERVNATDPFYFKLSQTPIPGEQPTVHWCLRSGKERGIFYMVDPDTVPSDVLYFDISVRMLYHLDFRPIQPPRANGPGPNSKSWPGKPIRRSEIANLTVTELLNRLPAPIPLQRTLQLPNELFDLYTASISSNRPTENISQNSSESSI
jgi:hypothetical protein